MYRLLIFFLFLPSFSYSHQIAFVNESKALIYADPEMKVPLGFLTKGKKIKVGEIKRNNSLVVPTVLSGKIVYIKVQDLYFKNQESDKPIPTKYSHFIEETESQDSLEPFRLTANSVFMNPGDQWNELMELTNSAQSKMFQLEALVELRLIQSSFFFDGGFVYSSLQGGNYRFIGLGFKGLVQFKVIDLDILSLDINAGFNFAPGGAKIIYNGFYNNGSYYGYLLGSQIRLLKNSNLNINVGINYNLMVLRSLENITLSNGSYKLNILKGAGIYLGVSFPL